MSLCVKIFFTCYIMHRYHVKQTCFCLLKYLLEHISPIHFMTVFILVLYIFGFEIFDVQTSAKLKIKPKFYTNQPLQ